MLEKDRRLFRETIYFVEADSFAVQKLWEHYNSRGFPSETAGVTTVEIGSIVDNKVTLKLEFRRINGKVICFYNMCGTYASWEMFRLFLEKAAPGVDRTDAGNFHNALAATRN